MKLKFTYHANQRIFNERHISVADIKMVIQNPDGIRYEGGGIVKCAKFLDKGELIAILKRQAKYAYNHNSIFQAMSMDITYDKQADAIYIYFQKGKKVARTVELADLLTVDLDNKGKVIGVEIIAASRQLSGSGKGRKAKNQDFLNFSLPLPA